MKTSIEIYTVCLVVSIECRIPPQFQLKRYDTGSCSKLIQIYFPLTFTEHEHSTCPTVLTSCF